MIEVHPDVNVHEQTHHEQVCTCHQCHRSFRAKSEDQYCLQLCERCFEAHTNLQAPVFSVHVKARPHGRSAR